MQGEQIQIAAIQRVTRNKLAIRQRQKTALELRLAGETFQSIADKLGYKSKHGSFRAVETALAEITRQPAESVRLMELERLDTLYRALSKQAESGDVVAIAGCLRITERRARLLGLDAAEPVRSDGEAIEVVTVAVDGSKI
jgi:ribosomal protein L15E